MSVDATSQHVRPAAVAGRFYPGEPAALRKMLAAFFARANPGYYDDAPPKALIAPHAGYVFSGQTAAQAFVRVKGRPIERVIAIGPSHFVPVAGVATHSAQAFDTPLGSIQLDRELISKALELSFVHEQDDAHAREHALEVHLPFLQAALDRPFTLAPFVFGDVSAEQVAELLATLWGGPETLIAVSSDLSHYYDYDTAREMDAATGAAIETLRPDQIGANQACGRLAIQGLLLESQRRGLRANTLDLRNSGDTAGSRDRVVGYGAWMFGK